MHEPARNHRHSPFLRKRRALPAPVLIASVCEARHRRSSRGGFSVRGGLARIFRFSESLFFFVSLCLCGDTFLLHNGEYFFTTKAQRHEGIHRDKFSSRVTKQDSD